MTTQIRLADDDPRVIAAVEATNRVQACLRCVARALAILETAKQHTQAADNALVVCKLQDWPSPSAIAWARRDLKKAIALQKADQAAYDRELANLADARKWKTPFCRLGVQAALAEEAITPTDTQAAQWLQSVTAGLVADDAASEASRHPSAQVLRNEWVK